MTEEEFEQLRHMTHASVQDENGIDVTQIDHVLSLSPTDRLRTLEEFLESLDVLVAGREKLDAEFCASLRERATHGVTFLPLQQTALP